MADAHILPVQAFAAQREIPVSAVLSRIRSGIYEGVEIDGDWHVVRCGTLAAFPSPEPSRLPLATRARIRSVLGWGILTLAGLFVWDLMPRPFYLPHADAARQIEAVVGFDLPRDFRVVETYDEGFAPGDLYYHFVVELSPDAKALFDLRWKDAHGDDRDVCSPCEITHSVTVTPLSDRRVRLDFADD